MNTNTVGKHEKQSHIIIELIECLTDSKVSTTVIKKSDNDVDLVTFNSSENEDTVIESSLFETYAMVLEGWLSVEINGVSTLLGAGEGKILPAFNSYNLDSKHRYKLMLTTVINGGY